MQAVCQPDANVAIAAIDAALSRGARFTQEGAEPLVCAVQAALYFPEMAAGSVVYQRFDWIPSLGLDFTLRMDGFAWMFSMLVLGYVYLVNQYRGIQTPVLLLAITAIIMAYVSNNTRFGRYAYAIGGNREAARLSGINIRRSIFLIFVLMGLLSGIAGIVLASYVGYGTIAAGQGYELDAIASAILGGTSTMGGVGTVFGALIGSLIMSSLTTGLQMLNVAPAWQYVVKGAVLVVAVYADVYFKKNR